MTRPEPPPAGGPPVRRSRRGHGLQGLRTRLVLGFVTVAFLTGVAAVGLAGLAFLIYHRFGLKLRGTEPTNGLVLLLLLALTVVGLLAVTVSLALLAAQRVLSPVRQLAGAAERMARGELGVRLPVTGDDEMGDLVRTFNEMATALGYHVTQLRRMEAQARRFVADVSHELRTPLAAMTAVADVLDDEAAHLHGNAAAAARLVSRETRNLNRLVDDLIEVSRFDAGTATLRLDEVDLAALVSSCLALRGWTGQVTTDLPPALLARVDPRRLDVVVANLVGNALRHGAAPVTVRLSTTSHQGQVWTALEVSDAGPGLPPEILPNVFDRFFKADTTRTRSQGSGLGLAIAMENARLHDGTIVATNRPGGGAVFTVWLPPHACADPGPGHRVVADPGTAL